MHFGHLHLQSLTAFLSNFVYFLALYKFLHNSNDGYTKSFLRAMVIVFHPTYVYKRRLDTRLFVYQTITTTITTTRSRIRKPIITINFALHRIYGRIPII
jgi:hypothetical protein